MKVVKSSVKTLRGSHELCHKSGTRDSDKHKVNIFGLILFVGDGADTSYVHVYVVFGTMTR